ncbi:hypothetical protein BVX95_00960 [archaeon D22]|nr:hypothetical protein BVX95_00960 [archaeon D22]
MSYKDAAYKIAEAVIPMVVGGCVAYFAPDIAESFGAQVEHVSYLRATQPVTVMMSAVAFGALEILALNRTIKDEVNQNV